MYFWLHHAAHGKVGGVTSRVTGEDHGARGPREPPAASGGAGRQRGAARIAAGPAGIWTARRRACARPGRYRCPAGACRPAAQPALAGNHHRPAHATASACVLKNPAAPAPCAGARVHAMPQAGFTAASVFMPRRRVCGGRNGAGRGRADRAKIGAGKPRPSGAEAAPAAAGRPGIL